MMEGILVIGVYLVFTFIWISGLLYYNCVDKSMWDTFIKKYEKDKKR